MHSLAGGASSQRQFLEIRDSEGDTPLHYAVKNGHASVIEMLLNIVPEMLNKQRSNGQTPIFDSLERPAILRLLLRHVSEYMLHLSPAYSFDSTLKVHIKSASLACITPGTALLRFMASGC